MFKFYKLEKLAAQCLCPTTLGYCKKKQVTFLLPRQLLN